MISFTVLSAFMLSAAGPGGVIAFVAGAEQDDHRVCLIDVATRNVTPVGPGQRDQAPVWSPDGARLAFASCMKDGIRVLVCQADGVELPSIVHAQEWNRGPRWSPDGSNLAYAAGNGTGSVLMVYDFATAQESPWGGGRTGLTRPVWMDNATLLAVGFVSDAKTTTSDLFRVTQDDAAVFTPALPANGAYTEWAPEISPDLKLIAFDSNDGGDREVFIFSYLQGSVDVSNHRTADWNPVWAPDSLRLAFESFRGGRRGLYVVDAARFVVQPVATAADSENWNATWSPDGRWLAFVSTRTGDPEIWVTDEKGGQALQLTEHPGDDLAPAWRPEVKP